MTDHLGRVRTVRKMILEARHITGFTVEEFAAMTHVNCSELVAVEEGEHPSPDLLVPQIAKALQLSEGWFFWDHETVASRQQTLELDTGQKNDHGMFQLELEELRFLVKKTHDQGGLPERQRPPYRAISLPDNAKERAMEVRSRNNLGSGPIRDLANFCENLGLLVFTRDGSQAPVDGLMAAVDGTGYGVCLIDSSNHLVRMRNALAHELGHWLGGDAFCDAAFGGNQERLMNVFAVQLLLPDYSSGIQRFKAGESDRDEAIKISADYGTGWETTLNVLADQDKISTSRRAKLLRQDFRPDSEDYKRLGIQLPLVDEIPARSRLITSASSFLAEGLNQKFEFPKDWMDRLHSLSEVKAGWLGRGEGEPVSLHALEVVAHLLESFWETKILGGKRPSLYPLIAGGIQLEWEDAAGDWSVEILNTGGALIFLFDDYDHEFVFHPRGKAADLAAVVFARISELRKD